MMSAVPLTSKQLVERSLAGQATPRPAAGPLAVHYCAGLAGVSLREFTSDARRLADCVLHYYNEFRPDAVWLSADTWVTAQAMGATVGFPGDDQPMAGRGKPLVTKLADVRRIPPPDPLRKGRWPLMIDALRYVKRAIGDAAYIVACFDQYPFSLACALMGIDQIMLKLTDDLRLVEELQRRCQEYTVAYGKALSEAGADMLSGGDSPAGLIGPVRYREVALPFERYVVKRLKAETGKPVSLHICGDATPILADMASSGADVLELDHHVCMEQACRILGPEKAVWGNLDPVGLLAQGHPLQVRAAVHNLIRSFQRTGHRRFVVSSGCTLAMETPAENLRSLFTAVRESANQLQTT